MHLSMYCPTTPLGHKWGFTGGIDTKLLPHYGAFDDRSVSAQIFFVVTSFAMSNPELIPRCNWGQRWGLYTIGLPIDNRVLKRDRKRNNVTSQNTYTSIGISRITSRTYSLRLLRLYQRETNCCNDRILYPTTVKLRYSELK